MSNAVAFLLMFVGLMTLIGSYSILNSHRFLFTAWVESASLVGLVVGVILLVGTPNYMAVKQKAEERAEFMRACEQDHDAETCDAMQRGRYVQQKKEQK